MRVIEVKAVNIVSEEPEFPEGFLTYEEALERVKAEVPVDGVEIVGWMQECEAANRVLEFFRSLYSSAGGDFRWTAGDGWIPGVSYGGDYYFARTPGWQVRRQGYAVVLPSGVRVPIGSWRWADLLKAIAMVGWVGSYQWNGLIAVFRKYARIPFRGKVVTPRVWGHVLPVVFENRFMLPAPVATYRVVVSSGSDARITFNFYNTSKRKYASTAVDVKRGKSEIVLFAVMPRSGYIEVLSSREITINEIDRIPPV